MHDVVIAGGGPTGKMLAAELALAGVDVAILERRPDSSLVGSRAGGFHSRTIEVFDQRGIADRFLTAGQTAQVLTFGSTSLDLADFPTRHPYTLGIWQNEIEAILAAWIAELPITVHYDYDATGFAQDAAGVDIEIAGRGSMRASYLVGCDGGRSVIRKAAGIDFPGWPATRSNLIAEIEASGEPPKGTHHDTSGVHGLHLLEDGRTYRVVTTEPELNSGSDPASVADLSASLVAAFGTDFGVHSPTWISRFTDATRQAASYRDRRVLLAGDAAHIHYPAGGQGLGLGVQDAVNLGWKLAQVVRGHSPDRLLDTYQAERHPVTARVLKQTMAQTAMQRRDERFEVLIEVISEVAALDAARRHLAGIMSGLDVHYDLGEGHPLLGRRMPDLDLEASDGACRVFELLHGARPVLLDLGAGLVVDLGAWSDRVQLVEARYDGTWELPVIGVVAAPTAVLIRPDGHVAWVGEGSDDSLTEALTTWFGPLSDS